MLFIKQTVEKGTILTSPVKSVQGIGRMTRAQAKKANISFHDNFPVIESNTSKRKLKCIESDVSKKRKIVIDCIPSSEKGILKSSIASHSTIGSDLTIATLNSHLELSKNKVNIMSILLLTLSQ